MINITQDLKVVKLPKAEHVTKEEYFDVAAAKSENEYSKDDYEPAVQLEDEVESIKKRKIELHDEEDAEILHPVTVKILN